MTKRILVINSGGLDSLIAIKHYHDLGYEQYSVFVDIGQPNAERALVSAQQIADDFGISHEVISVRSSVRESLSTPNQIREGLKVKTRVPYTGRIAAILGAIVAVCEDYDEISLGGLMPVRQGQEAVELQFEYSTFLDQSRGIGEKVVPHLPLVHCQQKQEAIDFGLSIGITKERMSQTVSCNKEEACGYCGKCGIRAENGIAIN